MSSLKSKLEALQRKAKERTVRTQSVEYDLETLVKKIKNDIIRLDPDYQRRHRWDNETSSRLIESLILNIPIPVVYISQDLDVDAELEEIPRYSIIDGQQRLTAIKNFFENNLTLGGLRALADLNGSSYKDLPPFLIRRLEERMIRCLRIDSSVDSQLKFDIFERLNSGSVQLEPQELRNAVYRGPFNNLIKKLALYDNFRILLQIDPHNPEKSIKVRKMEDAELVLRFFALYNGGYKEFRQDWKNFLSDKMKYFNELSEREIAGMESVFLATMDKARTLFGDSAFAKYKPVNGSLKRTSKFNRPIYEALSVGIASVLMDGETEMGKAHVESFEKLFHDTDFFESVSGTINYPQNIQKRIEAVREIFV